MDGVQGAGDTRPNDKEVPLPAPLSGGSSSDSSPVEAIRALLDPARVDELLRALRDELQPVGALEQILVRELAQKAAAMNVWGSATAAAVRQSAVAVAGMLEVTGACGEVADAVLAGAVGAEGTDRCTRRGTGHSRGFFRALQTLMALQAGRKASQDAAEAASAAAPPAFPSEQACEEYLVQRFHAGEVACSRCGATSGYLAAARKAWECAKCGRQIGLRAGTVMARSPLPLALWFDAVRWLLWQPTMAPAELAEKLGLVRLSTVRAVARRIREAMAGDDASARLAGLDDHFARRAAPEPGAPRRRFREGPQRQTEGRDSQHKPR